MSALAVKDSIVSQTDESAAAPSDYTIEHLADTLSSVAIQGVSALDVISYHGTTAIQEGVHPLLFAKSYIFMHVSKAAGDTSMTDSPKVLPVGVSMQGNGEQCYTERFPCAPEWGNCAF
jgi:hypothetical protein